PPYQTRRMSGSRAGYPSQHPRLYIGEPPSFFPTDSPSSLLPGALPGKPARTHCPGSLPGIPARSSPARHHRIYVQMCRISCCPFLLGGYPTSLPGYPVNAHHLARFPSPSRLLLARHPCPGSLPKACLLGIAGYPDRTSGYQGATLAGGYPASLLRIAISTEPM
ncbi:hypothetical protein Dimus_037432, partial [Dionaea muscipula]